VLIKAFLFQFYKSTYNVYDYYDFGLNGKYVDKGSINSKKKYHRKIIFDKVIN
jgi:hypothetical protein